MAEAKTRPTKASVAKHIATQTTTRAPRRLRDDRPPAGDRHQGQAGDVGRRDHRVRQRTVVYADGSTLDWPLMAFASRARDVVLYNLRGADGFKELLAACAPATQGQLRARQTAGRCGPKGAQGADRGRGEGAEAVTKERGARGRSEDFRERGRAKVEGRAKGPLPLTPSLDPSPFPSPLGLSPRSSLLHRISDDAQTLAAPAHRPPPAARLLRLASDAHPAGDRADHRRERSGARDATERLAVVMWHARAETA